MATTKLEVKLTSPMISVTFLNKLLEGVDVVAPADIQRLRELLETNKNKTAIPQIDVILCFQHTLNKLMLINLGDADFTETTKKDEKMTPPDLVSVDQIVFAEIINHCNESTWFTKNLFPCIRQMCEEGLLGSPYYEALARSSQRVTLYVALQSAPPEPSVSRLSVVGSDNPAWTSYELYFTKHMKEAFDALAEQLRSGFFAFDRNLFCQPYADLQPRSLSELLQTLHTLGLPERFNLNPLLVSLSVEQQSASAACQELLLQKDRRQPYCFASWYDYDRVYSLNYNLRSLRNFIQKEMVGVLSVPETAAPLKEKIARILSNPNVYIILSNSFSILHSPGEDNNFLNIVLQLAELDRNQLIDLNEKLEFYSWYRSAIKQQTISLQQMLALPKISSMSQELRIQLNRLSFYTAIEFEEFEQMLSRTNLLLILQIYNPLVDLNPENSLHLAQIRQQLAGLTKDQLLELQAKLQLLPLLALGFSGQWISLEQIQAIPKVSDMQPKLIAALQKPWVQEAWQRKLIDITHLMKLSEPQQRERIITLGNLPAEECFKQLGRRKVVNFLAGFHLRAGAQSPLAKVKVSPLFEPRLIRGVRRFLDAKIDKPSTPASTDDGLETSGNNYPVGGNSAGFWLSGPTQSSTTADAKQSLGTENVASLDDDEDNQAPLDSGPQPAHLPSLSREG